jgi:hypothetical protein
VMSEGSVLAYRRQQFAIDSSSRWGGIDITPSHTSAP